MPESESQIPELQQGAAAFAGAAPHQRRDPGAQFGQFKGLDDVIIAPGVQPVDHVVGAAFGRQKQNRQRDEPAVLAQLPAHGHTVHLRHHDVENQQVWRFAFQPFQRLNRRVNQRDLIPLMPQHTPDGIQNLRVVIHRKNRCHEANSSLATGSLTVNSVPISG